MNRKERSMAESTAEPKKVDFETGYGRLRGIGERLEDPNVPVSEMCDLYAEGRGLSKALLGYLDEREGELKEIDAGNNLPPFEITATAATPEADSEEADVPADTSHFEGAAGADNKDDDIPF
jgi:exonuclease VII small subunit